ncbi:TetR/AcrR family transcriptional regulator [Chitinasiproducens palmae]|uniref:Regulatory protein, tetR family n=1 Tax=Chitinasiproducens palmae TaxID=1770053 RepID=A0A1H2PK39_9BURK|nr:TetR/AcrR family transcriptional regulator [Chitinasiproducens palmae]SDV46750.1 regulatory protein, tetR family [Chitinasiproducens palmae]
MSDRTGPRPGGRSARVQAAVHRAVRELQQERDRAALTVPVIATRAGVTPSTIYRRWGDLAGLLADVAVERMRPDQVPADTGSFRGDVLAWLTQYADEMASAPGRAMLRDVLGTEAYVGACKCDGFLREHVESLRERARARGEQPPPVSLLVERIVAPLLYGILFTNETPTAELLEALFDQMMLDHKHR